MGSTLNKLFKQQPSSNDNKNQYQVRMTEADIKKYLRLLNIYEQFQDVLYVNTCLNDTCLFGNEDNDLVLLDYNKGKELKRWKGHKKSITKTLYCPKINGYLSASRDNTVKLWSNKSQQAQLDFNLHTLGVNGISCNPDNTLMISGSRDNSLILWDLQTGKSLLNAHINRNLVTDLHWSNDGKLLIQSGEDKEIRIWDPMSLKLIHSFNKKQYIQTSCHFNMDSTYAISTSNGFQGNGGEITLWDLRKMKLLHEFNGHEQTVSCAKFIQSSRRIVSCSHDSTVRLWDVASLKCIHSEYCSSVLTSVSEALDGTLSLSGLTSGLQFYIMDK